MIGETDAAAAEAAERESRMTEPLSAWRDGAVKNAILEYVEETCAEGSAGWVPAEERVAVFDNDGTVSIKNDWAEVF